MKFRWQRGGYRASMETVVEIEPKLDALAVILKVPPSAVTVEPYGGIDKRNGWDTYIVSIEGQACGFTDGPVQPNSAGGGT